MEFNVIKTKNLRHATNSIFEQIKNTSGKICVIVPDKLTVSIEHKLFDYLDIESSFDIEVSTLTRFSQNILTELNVNYTPISKLGGIILLKKILKENSESLKLFSAHSYSYNYCDEILKTISQFKASQISAIDLDLEQTRREQLANKLSDIKLILENYENQKSGLIDSCDRLNLLCMNIPQSETIKNTHFFFLGFDDFTAQGYSAIEQLIKNSLSVSIAIYDNNTKNKLIYSSDVYEKLRDIAYSQKLPFKTLTPDYYDDEIHLYLADNLLSIDKKLYYCNSAPNISLINARDIFEEADYIAKDIRKKIINGERYKNFGIAFYDLEKNKTIIANALSKYEINYYIDASENLSNTIYYKFYLNYLRLFEGNFQTNNIIELINSPFIKFPLEIKNKLIMLIRKINFSGNLTNLKGDEDLNEILITLNNLITNYPVKSNMIITDIVSLIQRIDEALDIENTMLSIQELLSDMYTKKILSQTKNSFDSLMHEISLFYPDITLNDVIDIMESAGNDQKIMPIPQSIDCVQVVDASDNLTNFDTLYIANCKHATAPAYTQDIGIILDKDIQELNINKKLSPTIAHLNKMSRFQMFNVMQLFDKELIITMSLYNSSEKSEIVKTLESRIAIEKHVKDKILIENIKINEVENTFPYIPLSKWDLVEYVSKNNVTNNLKLLRSLRIINNSVDHLSNNSLKLLNFKEISCSALESYFKCPEYFFYNNILRLNEEEQEGIAKVDIGNMLHKLAQDFYTIANRQTINIEQFCKEQIDKYMTDNNKLSAYFNTPIYNNLLKEGSRFIQHLNYLDENCMFTHTAKYSEYNFGINSKNKLPIADNVFLRGKIDRIDFYQDYVRIIDYKTGDVNANLSELYYGKKLQLFMYGRMAEILFDKKLAGTFYLPIKNSLDSDKKVPYMLSGFYVNNTDLANAFDKRISTTLKSDLMSLALKKDGEIKIPANSNKILYPNDFNKLMDYSLAVSSQAVKEINEGNVTASPIKFEEKITSCGMCPYLAVCRKNTMNIKFRTTKNVNLKTFGGNDE